MSDTTEAYGPRLAAWIDGCRGDQSMRSFAMAHGLDDARISAWKAGATPRVEHLRAVADGLGVTLGTVLVAAGMAREGELEVMTDQEPPAPDIDEAIEGDPNLTDDERAFLRTARETVRAVVEGARPRRSTTKVTRRK